MQIWSDCIAELPSLAHTQLVCLGLLTPQLAALPPLPSTLLQRAATSQEELEARFREAKSAASFDRAGASQHFTLWQRS